MGPTDNLTKRGIDFILGTILFLILSPIMVGIAGLVRIFLGSPVFFKQRRPGLQGDAFTLYKFRTMTDARGSDGALRPDGDRLTAFGRFLRFASIDELPELYNVLKGEMSLVGPRPLLLQYLDRYSPEQARRHEVKPGITGWAQIHGRNAVSWDERFKLDLFYVDHATIGLDLKILALTVGKVFRQEGITQSGQATMAEFMGTE